MVKTSARLHETCSKKFGPKYRPPAHEGLISFHTLFIRAGSASDCAALRAFRLGPALTPAAAAAPAPVAAMQQLQQRKSTLGFPRGRRRASATRADCAAAGGADRAASTRAAAAAEATGGPSQASARCCRRAGSSGNSGPSSDHRSRPTARPSSEQARQVHQLVRVAVPARHPRRVLAMPQCTNSGDLLTPRTSRRTFCLAVPRHDAGMV